MPQGVIIKALSGFYYVEASGAVITCRARGRFRNDSLVPLVGDRVEFETHGAEATVTALLPRRNAFVRPPVANIDVMVIIASGVIPVTEPFLIDRMAAIAETAGCEVMLCLNKCDLDGADGLFDTYRRAGFAVFRVSAETGEGVAALTGALSGKIAALTGNSGVGKSSILNAMGLDLAVGAVSDKLGRGRHTTRHVELYRLPGGALIVDTPGFSSFDTGVMALEKEDMERAFREFAPLLGSCRFRDCAHRHEPGCAIREAVERGEIGRTRYESYLKLLALAEDAKAREYK